MNNRRGIYWLSSYPKSGNTWFRIFLGNLLHVMQHDAGPIDINHVNDMINDHIATDRTWVNDACGFNTSWLTDDELDELMPTLYKWYSRQRYDVSYHKIHRAYTYIKNEQPLIPTEGCLGTVYFIRNPLDIAISMANHFFCSIDDAILMMNDPNYALYHYPLRQLLHSWSRHVKSWEAAESMNILFLRYEDMLRQPLETFTEATRFLQLDATSTQIEAAISYSSFEKLQQFENEVGFIDKPPRLKHFFRKGIADDWRSTLSNNQIQRIIDDHGDVMQTWGYINNQHEPI